MPSGQSVLGRKGHSSAEMAPWFEKMEQRLGIAPWALPPNANNDVIRKGCEKLGYSWHVIPRNVRGCFNLGYCGMGCPVNAKQSMLVTTIPAMLLAHRGTVDPLLIANTLFGGILAAAGANTLIDAMLQAAGYANATKAPYFAPVSLEQMVMTPPAAVVLGMFDRARAGADRWGPGRHAALRRAVETRAVAELPAALVGCPGWFAAEGAVALAKAAR